MSQEYVYWLSLRRQALLLSLADLLKFFFFPIHPREAEINGNSFKMQEHVHWPSPEEENAHYVYF